MRCSSNISCRFYEMFTIVFLVFLGEVDSHCNKIKAHVSRFPDIAEKRLMGFNKPKSYGHSVKVMNILSIISKVAKLGTHLESKSMFLSNMKSLEDIIFSMSRCVCNNDYLKAFSNSRLLENDDLTNDLVENFSVRTILQLYHNKANKLYIKNCA